MPPTGHALLGASSAHRWLACPPSARLEEDVRMRIGDTTSEAAAEGTLAHSLVELKLNRLLTGRKSGKATLQIKNDPLYRPVMEDYTDDYIGYVMEIFAQAQVDSPDAKLMSELRVDFSDIVPDGFGTTDTIIIADDTMHVIDFKYGKHVKVEAKGNPQLRLYAWGAYREYGVLYDIKTVVMHIVQPRMENTDVASMPLWELTDWAYDVVQPIASRAAEGQGEFNPGEHCFFCRAQSTCRAYAERQMEMAAFTFRDPVELTDEEIADLLPKVDEIVRWASKLKDYALDQAVRHGHILPGYKLVEGRANRKITDTRLAAYKLRQHGLEDDQMYTLKGLGDLEAVVGKKALSELLGDLIHKPQGKPVLVPESDKRPALSSAARAADLFSD